MSWLMFLFALEIGITPNIGVIQYPQMDYDVRQWGIGYTEISAEIELLEVLFAGGTVRTFIVPDGTFSFSPLYNVYDFNIGLRWKMLEVGVRHRCFHPMIAYQPILNIDFVGIEGAYDELYLRMSNK